MYRVMAGYSDTSTEGIGLEGLGWVGPFEFGTSSEAAEYAQDWLIEMSEAKIPFTSAKVVFVGEHRG